ncbi:uncharacterized protein LOC135198448 isoform X5 [Macrobrachium nipponense]|uniref:uncharacterized protein LOC135198448 isoform X5 n=1 Tax=Macrobrachium nipponense TaxID=159736 RepID=UPI0030C7C187
MMIMNLSTILEQLRGNSSTPGVDKSDVANYEPYASESGYGGGGGGGYGGYGSESGYGLSCASGYVNASAVALLAFLFLLNIVQDIVQQIQTRKKRDADEDNGIFAFINNGGLSTLKAGLPEIVLPLMVDLMEAQEAPHCLQRPLCEANLKLASNHGIVGKVVASLLSNVVSKAFSGDDTHKFHLALQAASAGRSGGNCSSLFRSCGGLSYLRDIREGAQTHPTQDNGDSFRQSQLRKEPERLDSNHVH